MRVLLLINVLILLCLPTDTAAQSNLQAEAEAQGPESSVPEEEFKLPENPYIEPLNARAKAITEGLTDEELLPLGLIRQSYGITRAVRVANDHVSEAVEVCGIENPSLHSDMSSRYESWWNQISSVLVVAEDFTQEVIEKQKVRDSEDIRGYLALVKQAADFTDESMGTVPVTTEDACRSLMQSMDSTQEGLIGLLNNIEIMKPKYKEVFQGAEE